MASPSGQSSPSRSWWGRGYVPFLWSIVGSGRARRRQRTERAPEHAHARSHQGCRGVKARHGGARLSGQQNRSSGNCSQSRSSRRFGVRTRSSRQPEHHAAPTGGFQELAPDASTGDAPKGIIAMPESLSICHNHVEPLEGVDVQPKKCGVVPCELRARMRQSCMRGRVGPGTVRGRPAL
jgi:hypothetical protein